MITPGSHHGYIHIVMPVLNQRAVNLPIYVLMFVSVFMMVIQGDNVVTFAPFGTHTMEWDMVKGNKTV